MIRSIFEVIVIAASWGLLLAIALFFAVLLIALTTGAVSRVFGLDGPKDPKLRAYWRQSQQSICKVDTRLLREKVGRGYWPVKALPLVLGAAAALWSLRAMLPVSGWINWLFALPFAVFIGVLVGQLTRAALVSMFSRSRKD